MNLLWIPAISALVLAEKIVPRGQELSLVAGVALTVWGFLRLVGIPYARLLKKPVRR